MESIDLLLVAAFAPELAGMERVLGKTMHGSVSGVSIACKTLGVGLPNAAAGAVLRIAQSKPRAVVLVGTAGAYGTAASIGEAIVVARAHLVDAGEVEGRAAMPEPMGRVLACHTTISTGLSGGRTATKDAANTLSITTDDALAEKLASATGCALENLEVFGVAGACAIHEVPFACVLGVSNRVGAAGRDEWRANHERASEAACEVVSRWLAAGAMGLPHVQT